MITILHNGDVTPYSPEFAGSKSELYGDFKIGNILEQSLEEIAHTLEASLLRTHVKESRDACRFRCKYFQLCGGAYFSNKWWENGSLLIPETQACKLHSQAVIEAFVETIAPHELSLT